MKAQGILAVAYGGGHIAMMLPVLRALRERQPDLDITLLALTTAARVARDAGETPLGYADLLHLLSPEEQAQALALGRALQPGNTHPDIPEAETVAYLGINAWDLLQQLGVCAADALLAAKGRQGFHPLHFFRRIVAHLQPDLVLATNSPRSEYAAVDAATEAGIPSLALLDLFALPGDAFAARKRYPSRVCVLSEAVRDNLIRAGWPPECIAITGNPAFDALNAPQTRAAGLALRAELGAPQRTLILLALQPEPATHPASPGRQGDPLLPERVLQACINSVRPHPDWTLIVRPHPSQPTPTLRHDPQLRLSLPIEPLHPLLHAVDAVITGTSTVALEAHLAGRRVLQLLDSITAPTMPYRALGVTDAVCHLTDLPQTLSALLAQPSMERAAVRDGPAAGPPQGGASPLGAQRGQSPSVGASNTAADRVAEQALDLLAATRPTPSPHA
jgi:hypothetical protein